MSNHTLLVCVAWWFALMAIISLRGIVRADGKDKFERFVQVAILLWEIALSWSAFALLYA